MDISIHIYLYSISIYFFPSTFISLSVRGGWGSFPKIHSERMKVGRQVIR